MIYGSRFNCCQLRWKHRRRGETERRRRRRRRPLSYSHQMESGGTSPPHQGRKCEALKKNLICLYKFKIWLFSLLALACSYLNNKLMFMLGLVQPVLSNLKGLAASNGPKASNVHCCGFILKNNAGISYFICYCFIWQVHPPKVHILGSLSPLGHRSNLEEEFSSPFWSHINNCININTSEWEHRSYYAKLIMLSTSKQLHISMTTIEHLPSHLLYIKANLVLH